MTIEHLIRQISDFMPFCLTVIMAVFFTSIIVALITNIRPIKDYKLVLWIACCPGVALHELAHCFFLKLGGIPITEVNLFSIERTNRGVQVGGSVAHFPPEDFMANFLAAIGPVIINGLVVSIVACFMQYLNEALAYYLIFAFTFGAHPSLVDLKSIKNPFEVNPGRSWFELASLFISFIPAWFFGSWNAHNVNEINWVLFFLAYFLSIAGLIVGYKALNRE